jgi:hypothetical protein
MWDGQRLSFAGFVLFFITLWLAVTLLLGMLGGWFRLQRRFPDLKETPLGTLRGQTGWMGVVQFRGILTLAACPTGLRVDVWRVFGAFHRPFLVPWNEIYAQHVPAIFSFLGTKAQLSFGNDAGSMRISASSWEYLVAFARDRPAYN